jgi:hypothetical protein
VRVPETVEADYLVVGAGMAGMGFVDTLIGQADVSVVMVDRRHSVGGHWLDAYPFVRLHQSSEFYGVASTRLGDGRIQPDGPEAGLHERATAPEVCAYYARVMRDRFLASGQVSFYPNCEYLGERTFVSQLSGRQYEVRGRCRVVDARYLAPEIPSEVAPPFGVDEGARVVPVNDLARLGGASSQYVIVGSGKTGADACVWLLENGVDPDAICWVRPRDPWMLNRAAIQPEPAVFLGAAADIVESAVDAQSPDELFLRLEAAGVMLRIDPAVTPTMAKAPTIAHWEIDQLRTIENVVRLGHISHAERGRLVFDEGEVRTGSDAVVVHCAAPGLQYSPLTPIWGPDAITVQLVRAGFPSFGAALAGYVEGTRGRDDEKNRQCPPSPYANTPTDWGRMQVLGYQGTKSFGAEPDLAAWANQTRLNPARIPPELRADPAVTAAVARFNQFVEPGMARLAELAGIAPGGGHGWTGSAGAAAASS